MKARAFLFLILTIFLILPTVCGAQAIRVGLETRAPMLRTTVDYHEGQWGLTQTATRFELGVIASQRGLFTAKYSLTTGIGGEETLTNPAVLVVGSTDFSVQQQAQVGQSNQQGGTQQNKSVFVSWKLPTTHRIEAAFGSYPVRPFVVGSSSWMSVEATGESKDGKVITDTETLQRFSWGLGGSYTVPVTQYAIGNIKGAFGRGYQFIEASVVGQLWPDLAVDAGYIFEDVKLDGFRLRRGGPFVGIIGAF